MNSARNLSLDLGLLLLRLLAGGMLLCSHGWDKIMHFGEYAASFPNPLGVGSTVSLGLVVFAEVFCSILVMLGLATRLSVIPIFFFLMVAVFIQHAHDPWAK